MNEKRASGSQNFKQRLSIFTNVKLQIIKSFAEMVVIILLINLLFIFTASSSMTSATNISTYGVISTTPLPLHVDGNKIKDYAGNIIYLRGVNKPCLAGDADGSWMGNTYWDDDRVKAELAIIKGLGANTIRCHQAVDNWKYNMIDSTSSIRNRDAVKRLIHFAGNLGMYVIFDPYTLIASAHVKGGGYASQDPLPYPPYQTSIEGSSVVGNEQDFVDYWKSVASELKDYPNVIFELWNEPHGDNTAKASWFNVVQQCINAIRATGATQLIIIQWDFGAWVNLDYSTSVNDLSWIFDYQLHDPLKNLIYSTHLYRSAGHIQKGGGYAYNLSDIDTGLRLMRYYDAAQTYPLLVGEIGAALGSSEQMQELEFFQNALTLFNQHGISYIAWAFWNVPPFRLHNGPPTFVPSESGQILKKFLTNPLP